MRIQNKAVFLVIVLLYVGTCNLTCSPPLRARKGGIQYPSSMNLDCPAATTAAEGSLTSYHYRKACKDKFNLPAVPANVAEVDVIDCFEAPAPGWSDGTIVEVEICCNLNWGPWLDRDNPSGDGDWENIPNFLPLNQACANPLAVQCRTVQGQVDSTLTGETVTCNTATGFVCRNTLQADGRCQDYEVRFAC